MFDNKDYKDYMHNKAAMEKYMQAMRNPTLTEDEKHMARARLYDAEMKDEIFRRKAECKQWCENEMAECAVQASKIKSAAEQTRVDAAAHVNQTRRQVADMLMAAKKTNEEADAKLAAAKQEEYNALKMRDEKNKAAMEATELEVKNKLAQADFLCNQKLKRAELLCDQKLKDADAKIKFRENQIRQEEREALLEEMRSMYAAAQAKIDEAEQISAAAVWEVWKGMNPL